MEKENGKIGEILDGGNFGWKIKKLGNFGWGNFLMEKENGTSWK